MQSMCRLPFAPESAKKQRLRSLTSEDVGEIVPFWVPVCGRGLSVTSGSEEETGLKTTKSTLGMHLHF
jgi:hypothetical protein